jgi:hypothetical protein
VTTYRALFASREFRALFAAQLFGAGASTAQSLALSVIFFSRTHSPLLAAVAYLGGYVPQAIGVAALASVADRVAPRRLIVGTDLLRTASFAVLATNALPVAAMLAVVMVCGLWYGAVGGVRYLVLRDMLPVDDFILGRATLNLAVGGMQIVGYAMSGTLLVLVGPVTAMWTATGLVAAAATIDRLGLRARPARGTGRASVGISWQANRRILADRRLRRLLGAQWLPNGLIVGAEALYVPYAEHRAVFLFIAAAAGMLAGDLLVGRWVPTPRRPQLSFGLYLLLATPYLGFLAHPSVAVATALVAVASVGYGGTLGIQQVFADTVDPAEQGQAFSLASAGQLSSQGVAAWLAGGLAEAMPTGTAMAVTAGMSVTASLLVRGVAGPAPEPATGLQPPASASEPA